MNISKSIDVCLKDRGMKKYELAEKLEVSKATVSTLCRSNHCSPAILEKLCTIFGMKSSEFIALGE